MPGLLSIGEMGALALHTMLEAARLQDTAPGQLTSVADLAERLEASRHTLHKVTKRLVGAGFLESSRGPQGGVRLSPGAEKITLMQIIEAVDGKLSQGGCLFARRVCEHDAVCQFCGITVDLESTVRTYFLQTTLEQLLDRLKSGQRPLPEITE